MDETPGGKEMVKKGGFFSLIAAIDWSLIAFVFALCGLAFGYGAAMMQFRIFPYHQILNAKYAFESLGLLEDESVMMSINSIDEKAMPAPVVTTLDAAAGEELLLVTGGPNQDAKHCPKFGCLAWIVDRKGAVKYSWPLDLEGLFGDADNFSGHASLGNFYPVGIQLQNDGTLIATFHGRNIYPYAVGIAHIGRKGEILWKKLDNAHHWLTTTEDGMILAPIQLRPKVKYLPGTSIVARCPTPVYDEGIRVYRPDGSTVKTLSALTTLSGSGFPGLLYGLRDDCDPIHLNSADIITPAIAANIPGVAAGDYLVSLREPSVIAILDQHDGHVKKLVAGRTAAQHSAHFLPDGSVVAFDNLGGVQAAGGSRIARVNLNTGETTTLFPTVASKPVMPFYSSDGGHVSVSPDGKRLMISSKDESRDIEIDVATGKPLWTMTRILDIAPFMSGGDKAKPVAARMKSYGTYYVSPRQAQALGLTG